MVDIPSWQDGRHEAEKKLPKLKTCHSNLYKLSRVVQKVSTYERSKFSFKHVLTQVLGYWQRKLAKLIAIHGTR